MLQLSIILPLGLYLASHLLRCARLYVLSLGERRGGARLVAVHCGTAWLGAVIPFKLGEVLRLGLFGAAVGSPVSGGSIWLIERLNDAISVVVLVITLSLVMPIAPGAYGALYVAGGFIIACVVGTIVLMETIPYLNRDLVLRSRSRKGLILLRVVRSVEAAFEHAKRLLIGRLTLTIVMSLMIWACEFAALAAWSWGTAHASQADLILVFLSDQSDTFAQRAPAFLLLTAIGAVIAIAIWLRVRGIRHART